MLVRYRIPLKYFIRFAYVDAIVVLLVSIGVFFTIRKIDFPIIPINIPAFMGTAISLLLGFKLSQSYDRWWEARKIWGAIVNDSRTLTMQLLNYHTDGKCEITERMAMRQAGWSHSLGQSLRGLSPLGKLDEFISAEELARISEHSNIPLALLNEQSADLKRIFRDGKVNEYQQIQIDKTLVRLCESMGRAERIKNTVFPTTYRLFLHLFIYLFITLLAVALAEVDRLWEIPLLVLISLPFFLLEKTALYLQDPFENRPTDVSVSAIAHTIELNIKQLLSRDDLPAKKPVLDDFFVM
ncbi:putative membrane protein [Reichenbachiella agariperforans]|uniref:Putative membrane protein n=1 Tax=Reichenbachiella agariperforans TaxID=156994 RepID=A0A1M6U8V6_REIAG|nr:bestrophin family ion channel [Reichenbachiella agariperforans]SHK65617.1 putative membrane protein [Reichenbachiella agariperforans]